MDAREAEARFRPRRRPTRVVSVGDVAIGGAHPIRLQSMTNTDTLDTEATVAQTIRLVEAGCEIVRVTAPSIREAESLREIRRALTARGVRVPLVADIHFTPNAAMIAAELVEKVRINPGNYADKKKFEVREYSDVEYAAEIERVRARFRPLVVRCRENGVAMRIGTNHGSLSDRIMNRFGDTAEGMVESALEFLDVCEDESFFDVVFSMKASNTRVAIEAYRRLAERLDARTNGEPSYPFHVGVTEAGDGEDGRIKSAIGIGALLEDGIGDTIRVSLTEDPVREIPVARAIAARAQAIWQARGSLEPPKIDWPSGGRARSPRGARPPPAAAPPERSPDHWGELVVGGEAPVRVELDLAGMLEAPAEGAARLAIELAGLRDVACESLLVEVGDPDAIASVSTLRRELASLGLDLPLSLRLAPAVLDVADGARVARDSVGLLGRLVVPVSSETPAELLRRALAVAESLATGLEWELQAPDHAIPALVERLATKVASRVTRAMSLGSDASLHDYRVLDASLASGFDVGAGEQLGRARPLIVLRQRLAAGVDLESIGSSGVAESSLVDASVRLGGLLCDGIGELVSIRPAANAADAVDLGYRILQGARARTTRTEYISCPSCGRTLFDLEETTARIKARTDHLKGVKIAVMGCIVNGPGEMADADFGYVGSGVGQVTLYVGKQVVARAVPEAEATDRLVELIQDHGVWVEGDAD